MVLPVTTTTESSTVPATTEPSPIPWTPIPNLNVTWSYPIIIALSIIFFLLTASISVYWTHKKKGHNWHIPHRLLFTSYFHNVTPKMLFAFRLAVMLYGLALQFTYITWQIEFERLFEYQLWTQWNFGLFILYFTLSSALSFGSIIYDRDTEEDERASGIGKVIFMLFQICFVEVFVVDVAYWSVLVPGFYILEHELPPINFFTFNHHGVNALLMITEFVINKIPISFNHIWVFMLWPCCYVMFTLMMWPVSLVWPYPILNAWVPLGVMWYAVFFVSNFVVFCGCYGLHILKKKCFGVIEWDGSGEPVNRDIQYPPLIHDF
eukprot:TRINITY_DN11753_c0_g1_i1.p1 TRINITY_DN11753_c0_g1~~TRINITY_DN11753_c0_g1_i1.p1  ORF type:complete len:336 (+),score=25.55 TRINITY_DN11753_c0_g1_i1:46-1008(+)